MALVKQLVKHIQEPCEWFGTSAKKMVTPVAGTIKQSSCLILWINTQLFEMDFQQNQGRRVHHVNEWKWLVCLQCVSVVKSGERAFFWSCFPRQHQRHFFAFFRLFLWKTFCRGDKKWKRKENGETALQSAQSGGIRRTCRKKLPKELLSSRWLAATNQSLETRAFMHTCHLHCCTHVWCPFKTTTHPKVMITALFLENQL